MTARRSWDVQIRLIDEAGNKQAETAVTVSADHPGAACAPAYVVLRDDVKRSSKKLPPIALVQFLVRAHKGENQPS